MEWTLTAEEVAELCVEQTVDDLIMVYWRGE
jgi:hypothetical protein